MFINNDWLNEFHTMEHYATIKRGKQIFMYWYFMMSKIYCFVKSQLQNYNMSQFMFKIFF